MQALLAVGSAPRCTGAGVTWRVREMVSGTLQTRQGSKRERQKQAKERKKES
jgi:hypothetical protein